MVSPPQRKGAEGLTDSLFLSFSQLVMFLTFLRQQNSFSFLQLLPEGKEKGKAVAHGAVAKPGSKGANREKSPTFQVSSLATICHWVGATTPSLWGTRPQGTGYSLPLQTGPHQLGCREVRALVWEGRDYPDLTFII